MKASELMLYDWVQHDTMGVTRVVQLDYFSSIKKPREGIGLTIRYAEEYVGVVNTLERLVHGIPLTAEILVKNGFLRHKSISWGEVYTYKWIVGQEDKALDVEHHFRLSPDPYEGTGFHWVPEMSAVSALCIRYVHELQHVMRMCGIKKEIEL